MHATIGSFIDKIKNPFQRVLMREHVHERALGSPIGHIPGGIARRKNAMSLMTGGRGFPVPPAGPKLSKGGKTRRELVAAGVRPKRYLKVRP
jgi:hypothetical protein